MAKKPKRCCRCNRRLRGAGAQWCVDIALGAGGLGTVDAIICPRCATPWEHLQREVNDSTVRYEWVGNHVKRVPKFTEAAGAL